MCRFRKKECIRFWVGTFIAIKKGEILFFCCDFYKIFTFRFLYQFSKVGNYYERSLTEAYFIKTKRPSLNVQKDEKNLYFLNISEIKLKKSSFKNSRSAKVQVLLFLRIISHFWKMVENQNINLLKKLWYSIVYDSKNFSKKNSDSY